jgi:hypothetical protein
MGIVVSPVQRKSDSKSRTATNFTIHLYHPAMLFNDAMGYCQSETGSTFPGGKKRIKNLAHVFL